MANNVTAQIVGGATQVLNDVDSIKEVRKHLKLLKDDYAATNKGEPVDDTDDVEDFDFVAFAPKVRGGK